MATVGQQLTAPETGWRRYDDTDSRIIYDSSFNKGSAVGTSGYNGTLSGSSNNNCKVTMKFYGTKFRIISYRNTGDKSPTNYCTIDGVKEVFDCTGVSTPMVLVYEKTGLPLGVHEVTITATNLVANSVYLTLDAFDIDDTGYFVHPILNQVSNFENMQIGDCIPVRYYNGLSGITGIFFDYGNNLPNEIPVASSATPYGIFYLIKVAKGLYIADRVAEHSVSWDALNTAKLIEGCIRYIDSMVPTLTDYSNSNGYTVKDSGGIQSYQGFYYYGWRLFNDVYAPWQVAASSGAWVEIDLPNPVILESYALIGSNTTGNRSPKSFTIQGSNDGSTWTTIDTRSSETGWSIAEHRLYKTTNTAAYSKYRIYITANNGDSSLELLKWYLYSNTSRKALVRSVSGGDYNANPNDSGSSVDYMRGAWPTNNEWDKYIVKSNLNGKITPGDNDIWHWGKGGTMFSWAKETPMNGFNGISNNNPNRVMRGTNSSTVFNVQGVGSTASSVVNTGIGFRPVFEILETGSKGANIFY